MSVEKFLKFHRGLNPEALEDVQTFLETGIGKELIRFDGGRPKFQMFIRKNYIDFYWKGCRVLGFHPNATKNKFIIHHKYTSVPKDGDKANIVLVEFDGGTDLIAEGVNWSFRDNIIKSQKSLEKYVKGSGRDKRGEKDLLWDFCEQSQFPIVDVEIAFSISGLYSEKKKEVYTGAKRIDLVRLNTDSGKLEFIEAKLDSDSRLRSTNDGDQEILRQMDYYAGFLKHRTCDIKKTYQLIATNICDLGLEKHLMTTSRGTKREKIHPGLPGIMTNCLIHPEPLLLVFSTDDNRKFEENGHLKRLEDRYGSKQLIRYS